MNTVPISILAIGAATQDVFLSGKAFTAKRDVRSHEYMEAFPLGAKLEVDRVDFDTGGGATNAAITFARQGMETGFVGKIGLDPAGAEVLRVLRKEGVNIDHVAKDPRLGTGFSTLLVAPSGERTVLVYRGASSDLKGGDFNVKQLKADWFYISSLAGNLALLAKLLDHARIAGIQVALNPGKGEIAQAKKLRKLLTGVNVLIANREELEALFPGENTKQTLQEAAGICHYVVMTDGPKGSYVCDRQQIYFAGIYQKVKILDRTGAGDAFGSGFVAAIARGEEVADALTLASANSTAVVQKIGAKKGILKHSRLRRMKVKTVRL